MIVDNKIHATMETTVSSFAKQKPSIGLPEITKSINNQNSNLKNSTF
jgi:hypothetical protein